MSMLAMAALRFDSVPGFVALGAPLRVEFLLAAFDLDDGDDGQYGVARTVLIG